MDDDCHRVGWIYGDSLTTDELKNLNPESKTKWGDGNEATKLNLVMENVSGYCHVASGGAVGVGGTVEPSGE